MALQPQSLIGGGQICKKKLTKMRVRRWTRFGWPKSVDVFIKIYACNSIIHDYVKSEYNYLELI